MPRARKGLDATCATKAQTKQKVLAKEERQARHTFAAGDTARPGPLSLMLTGPSQGLRGPELLSKGYGYHRSRLPVVSSIGIQPISVEHGLRRNNKTSADAAVAEVRKPVKNRVADLPYGGLKFRNSQSTSRAGFFARTRIVRFPTATVQAMKPFECWRHSPPEERVDLASGNGRRCCRDYSRERSGWHIGCKGKGLGYV